MRCPHPVRYTSFFGKWYVSFFSDQTRLDYTLCNALKCECTPWSNARVRMKTTTKMLHTVWPEVVFYHQSGVLGHLCGVEILAVVFSLKRVTFQFWPVNFIKKGDFSNIFYFFVKKCIKCHLMWAFFEKNHPISNYQIIFKGW